MTEKKSTLSKKIENNIGAKDKKNHRFLAVYWLHRCLVLQMFCLFASFLSTDLKYAVHLFVFRIVINVL